MIIDSYPLFKEFISQPRDKKPTLLLHSCCAPCSSYVLELLKNVFEITIFFYNPSIFPKEEYDKRLIEFSKLGKYKIIEGKYEIEEYNNLISGLENIPEGGSRCFICYEQRLEKAAKLAANDNYDFFTTTLSISPYKNSNKINEIGQRLASKYKTKFLYSNFKKEDGYKKSIQICNKLRIYRQKYCGCYFSLQARKDGIKAIAEVK